MPCLHEDTTDSRDTGRDPALRRQMALPWDFRMRRSMTAVRTRPGSVDVSGWRRRRSGRVNQNDFRVLDPDDLDDP
jgi:hypothetical protein